MTRNEKIKAIKKQVEVTNDNGWKYSIRINGINAYTSFLPLNDRTIYADSKVWEDNEIVEYLPNKWLNFLYKNIC